MFEPVPAQQPTMYFLGVSTGASSIMRIFPQWASELGLEDARLLGVDLPLGAEPERYRDWLAFLKADPNSRGALVTSHKLDVVAHAGDLFDYLDPFATAMREVSAIYKRDGKLLGAAVDADTSARSLAAIVPDAFGADSEVLILGGGGAALAIIWALLESTTVPEQPRRILVTDINRERLAHIRSVWNTKTAAQPSPCLLETVLVKPGSHADDLMGRLPPGSMVINATGMGKDRPGSPLAGSSFEAWPNDGLAWELNYRGERLFLQQAEQARVAVRLESDLNVADGWRYFLLGWTRVIGLVFDREIPSEGPLFDRLAELAAAHRGNSKFIPSRS